MVGVLTTSSLSALHTSIRRGVQRVLSFHAGCDIRPFVFAVTVDDEILGRVSKEENRRRVRAFEGYSGSCEERETQVSSSEASAKFFDFYRVLLVTTREFSTTVCLVVRPRKPS